MDDQLDQLHDIIVESEDLHADGMRSLKDPLTELVEHHNEQRAQLETAENEEFAAAHRSTLQNTLAGTAIAAAGGGLLLTLLASPAYASSSSDAQILQTAASIEVLAVNTYKTALTLPYIGGATANKVVTAFVTTTMGQHSQHLQAFNAALTAMGSKTQTNPDPAFVPVVNKAVASLAGVSDAAGALAVVGLALELENAATETYVNDCSMLSDKKSVALMASIMGVEAQHAATLLAVQALLMAGAGGDIALSPATVGYLPAAAGSVGFPNSFYPTSGAAPASQGAVS